LCLLKDCNSIELLLFPIELAVVPNTKHALTSRGGPHSIPIDPGGSDGSQPIDQDLQAMTPQRLKPADIARTDLVRLQSCPDAE